MELKTVQYQDGKYRWRCKTDNEYKQYEYHYALRMGWAICGSIILLGFLLVPMNELFLCLLLTTAIIILIVLAVSRYILNRSGFETVPFEMTEEYICMREGKGRTFVSFKSVKRVETEGNRIDLFTRFSKVPVYIPEEDFGEISDMIIRNIRERAGTAAGIGI